MTLRGRGSLTLSSMLEAKYQYCIGILTMLFTTIIVRTPKSSSSAMVTVVRYAICKLMRQYVINNFRISYSDCFHDGSGVVAFNDKPDVLSLILGN